MISNPSVSIYALLHTRSSLFQNPIRSTGCKLLVLSKRVGVFSVFHNHMIVERD
jgi:hypothetical protein